MPCVAPGWSLLSVPSSSGKSTEPLCGTTLYLFDDPFQSPPHRGSRRNELVRQIRPVRFPHFQSPPHRGSRRNRSRCPRNPTRSAFQSPPHRGSRRNDSACAITSAIVRSLSVPSSSGKSTEHYRRSFLGGANDLSVPSSSGKSTEQLSLHAMRCVGISFSPLLIGEVDGTLRLREAIDHDPDLSVPSSSGKSTEHPQAALGITVSYTFQSPPHRGSRRNTPSPAHPVSTWRLSVPSSSGKSTELIVVPS